MMEKIEIARRELGAALQLFLDDACPVSVHVLAAAGAEIVEGLAIHLGEPPFRDLILKTLPHYSPKQVNDAMRIHANAFKHFTAFNGKPRDDAEAISIFNDEENASLLHKGWKDYARVTKTMPLEAQATEIWYLSRAIGPSFCEGVGLQDRRFIGLRAMTYDAAKKVLQEIVTEMKGDAAILADPRTERGPLMMRRL
jgi:hypothetical protein